MSGGISTSFKNHCQTNKIFTDACYQIYTREKQKINVVRIHRNLSTIYSKDIESNMKTVLVQNSLPADSLMK